MYILPSIPFGQMVENIVSRPIGNTPMFYDGWYGFQFFGPDPAATMLRFETSNQA